MGNKINTEIAKQFIELKYPNKFDFSKFIYTKAADKVTLICKDCGLEFKTTYNILRNGKYGCPNCYRESTKINKKDFVKRILNYYGNNYDCSEVNYKNIRDYISLKCNRCGTIFDIKASQIGKLKELCPICSKQISVENNFQKFLDRFEKSNLNLEIISNNFVNYKTKMTFRCIKCGEIFESTLDNILASLIGCPKCAEKSRRNSRKIGTEKFVGLAKLIHGEKYIYDKVEYINKDSPVCIICPKHGEFLLKGNHHLRGHGCPKCNRSKGEVLVSGILDKYNIKYRSQVPIINVSDYISDFNHKIIIDFVIKNNDSLYIIEYNGRQHYEPVKYFGGEEAFKTQKKRDLVLRELCRLKNIKLLEIRYDNTSVELSIVEFLNI